MKYQSIRKALVPKSIFTIKLLPAYDHMSREGLTKNFTPLQVPYKIRAPNKQNSTAISKIRPTLEGDVSSMCISQDCI